MKRAKRILAPVDLTDNSRRGLRQAFSLSLENSADLIILHVAKSFPIWDFEDLSLSYDTLYEREADRTLSDAAADLNRFLQNHLREALTLPSVIKRVVSGEAAKNIIAVAEEEDIELIVLAPNREIGFKRLLFGSITDTVIREAPCPVLSMSPPRRAHPSTGSRLQALFGALRPVQPTQEV